MSPRLPSFVDQDFMRQLERLELVVRKSAVGKTSGERRSIKKGRSVEFADFRDYAPGDDTRLVDWNAYARLERLFLKLYLEEQEATVNLLLDASGSMSWGEAAADKGLFARWVAAAIGYLALRAYDRVAVGALADDLVGYLRPVRGMASLWRLWEFIEGAKGDGLTHLARSVRSCGRFITGPGVTILISDFLAPTGYQEALDYLLFLKQEVTVVQVLAPDELQPALSGDLRLIDRESGASCEVSVTPGLLRAYRRRLEGFREELSGFCLTRGISFISISSATRLEEALFDWLRRAGLVS